MIHDPILIRNLELKNRLVMPPKQTDRSDLGHVTDHMVQYYADRAKYSQPGLIISEHCCITEQGRASRNQLSIAEDGCIAEHRQVTDAIHEAGSRVFIQLNQSQEDRNTSPQTSDSGRDQSTADVLCRCGGAGDCGRL